MTTEEKISIVTGSKELDRVVKALSKKFGKANQFSMGPKYEKARPIPTDALTFDAATNIGGVARGRIVEIAGPYSSGKTSLLFWLIKKDLATYPEDKRPAMIIDMERSIDTSIPLAMGIDPSAILFCYADTAEEALQTLVDVASTGAVRLIGIDSIDAMQSEARIAKDVADNEMCGIAKLLGTAMRQVSKSAPDHETTVILLNQFRDTMDKYKPNATSGGKAIRFYASQCIELMETSPSKTVPKAFLMRPKLVKNKMGPPHKVPIEIDFQYAIGPDYITELIKYCKVVGVLRSAGKAVIYTDEHGVVVRLSKTGMAGFDEACTADPELLNRIRNSALAVVASNTVEHIQEGEVAEAEEPLEE